MITFNSNNIKAEVETKKQRKEGKYKERENEERRFFKKRKEK